MESDLLSWLIIMCEFRWTNRIYGFKLRDRLSYSLDACTSFHIFKSLIYTVVTISITTRQCSSTTFSVDIYPGVLCPYWRIEWLTRGLAFLFNLQRTALGLHKAVFRLTTAGIEYLKYIYSRYELCVDRQKWYVFREKVVFFKFPINNTTPLSITWRTLVTIL